MSALPQVTVIVMAYNEAATLESVVVEIGDTLSSATLDYEILIVDDGSKDGTSAIADAVSSKDARVRVIHHEVNRGVGEVYRSGFAGARGALVTFLPADGQFPATIVPMMVNEAGEADLVLGYLPEQQGTRSLTGKMLSAAEKLFYRVLFGAMPKFQGVLMFRRALLDEVRLTSTGRGWTVLTELIVRGMRRGWRMRSVPTPLRKRMAGESKVNNLRTVLANVRQALALRATL